MYTYPFRRPRGIVLHPIESTLEMGDLDRMDAAVLVGEVRAAGGESLLADAGRAVWPTRDPDTARAVLLAAIALEMKTPETLRGLARRDQQELLELLLTNYEEVPASVKFQLSQVAEVGDAHEPVSAAREAFAWLDGLTPTDPTVSA